MISPAKSSESRVVSCANAEAKKRQKKNDTAIFISMVLGVDCASNLPSSEVSASVCFTNVFHQLRTAFTDLGRLCIHLHNFLFNNNKYFIVLFGSNFC